MYAYKKDGKLPVKVWSEEGSIEEEAIEQIENAATLPFAFHHVCLMPDGHVGYGAPIGGVLATKGVVVPNFVGVDIGCGMCAVKTNLVTEEIIDAPLKKIMGAIREEIPLGFEHRAQPVNENYMPLLPDLLMNIEQAVTYGQYESGLKQLGTLGGGNHFIEIQRDEDQHIWIMIHSGSRNMGKKVADHWNKNAQWHNEKWFSEVPKKWELAFLPIETDEAKDYISEMKFCVAFALANREYMMEAIKDIFEEIWSSNVTFEPMINIAHNYAAWEHHFGEDVLVHRKGATRAREGEIGIIPGSMGTSSYIVSGLGNINSFYSCSHGAGRKMGRKDATRRLDLAEQIRNLDSQGIIHGIRNVGDLDEAPGAYKSIDEVMENQKDLVKIVTKLRPLAVIKG